MYFYASQSKCLSLEVPKQCYNDANFYYLIPQMCLVTRISRQTAAHNQDVYLCLTVFARLFFETAVAVRFASSMKIILCFYFQWNIKIFHSFNIK